MDTNSERLIKHLGFNRDQLVEVERCGICSSDGLDIFLDDPPFKILRCTACNTHQVTPQLRLESLSRLYGEKYWNSDSPKDYGYSSYQKNSLLYKRTFKSRAQFVLSRIGLKGGKVLDVGCASGFFLSVMSELGWETWGVELSESAVDYAKKVEGLTHISYGNIHNSDLQNSSFDLITFWDVIEHLPKPTEALRRAHELLKPGGFLVVETQNIASAFARLLGKRWHHYKHLEHLYHFSEKTLSHLLESLDFEVVHSTSRFGGKYVPIEFIRERSLRLHPLMKYVAYALKPWDQCAIYVNVFDEVIMIVQKPKPL